MKNVYFLQNKTETKTKQFFFPVTGMSIRHRFSILKFDAVSRIGPISGWLCLLDIHDRQHSKLCLLASAITGSCEVLVPSL